MANKEGRSTTDEHGWTRMANFSSCVRSSPSECGHTGFSAVFSGVHPWFLNCNCRKQDECAGFLNDFSFSCASWAATAFSRVKTGTGIGPQNPRNYAEKQAREKGVSRRFDRVRRRKKVCRAARGHKKGDGVGPSPVLFWPSEGRGYGVVVNVALAVAVRLPKPSRLRI